MKRRRDIELITHVHFEQPEDATRPLNMGLIRRMFSYTRAIAGLRNMLLVIVVIRAIQLPCLAWTIGAVLGGPVTRHDLRGILLGAFGYALLTALTHLTLKYRVLLAMRLGEQVVHNIRNDMFGHLQDMTMRFFNTTKVGRIISRFTSDAEAIRNGVQNALFVSMVAIGQMIVASIFMLKYDWVLFLVVCCMTPGIWLICRFFHGRLSRAYRVNSESFSRVTGALAESISGIRVTHAFAREDRNGALFRQLVSDHGTYNVRIGRLTGIFFPILETNSQLFVALTLLIGGWRVFYGHADVEAIYQFLLMSGTFFGPIQSLAGQYDASMSAMAGAERVFRFLDTKPEWSDPPDAISPPACAGRIELHHVTFGYESDKPVLHDISFTAEPGRIVALVGQTGSGKSSIVNLVAKFYLPWSGEVTLDGTDLRRINSTWLHRQMGIVLQQNFLFSGTVLDNICMASPGTDIEDARAAARQLGCLDIIEALPKGFETEVGEGGSGVSLGQRQLICFTRAMLANPRILILDEATSAVDTITEARIQATLGKLLTGRTSIVVAHRLSTVRHADLVLVLDNGRIVERGAHRELLQARGTYARMYRKFVRPVRDGRRTGMPEA